MRFFLITTISILLIGCNNEVKETCLQESLVQKLNDFKVELADSLSIPTKQITLVEILVKKSQERKHIPINLIEFSSKEIESLIDCYSDLQSPISDSSFIRGQIRNSYFKPIGFKNLIGLPKETEYLVLFWLYQLIDKSFISNEFILISNTEVYLNGELLKNFDEISEKLVLQNPNISDFNKRAIISIKADKNNVDMDAIDKIETVLREVNALRINYSILNTKK